MKKKVVKLEDLELEVYKNEIKLNRKALALAGGKPVKQKTLDEIFNIVISKKEV